jgi:hypothetical protein
MTISGVMPGRVLPVLGMTSLLILSPAYAQQPPSDAAAPTVRLAPPPAADLGQDATSGGADNATEIAKKLQNPIGDIYSIPFQNNTNFNAGTKSGTQNILNIQPVIPIHLNDQWNVITRTILPLVWSPTYQPAPSIPFGLAPTSFSAFLSPKNPVNGWVWGVGPIAQLPTITNKTLGSNVWGLGPAVVVVKLAGPIVTGALVNNVFSLGGTSGPTAFTQFACAIDIPVTPCACLDSGCSWNGSVASLAILGMPVVRRWAPP